MAELDPEELLEESLKKTGPDLFKELFRLYPAAEVEDYYKNGAWKNDIMKTDIVLFTAHREEAGSPDPPPLEDLKIPGGLPEEKKWTSAWTPAAVSTLGSFQTVKMPGIQTAATITPAASVPGGTVAELRLIALFVAKWKLDPTKTKANLAKMTPERRRFVVTNFKTDKTGVEATEHLQKYIEECETDGKWDKDKPAAEKAKATATSPATTPGATTPAKVVTPKVGVAAPKPVGMMGKPMGGVITPATATMGVKRPWGATGGVADGASKWPKTVSPGARPPMVTGVRPGFGAVRPPQVVSAKRPGMPVARPQASWNGKPAWGW